MNRSQIEALQLDRLRELVTQVVETNRFYGPRLRAAGLVAGPQRLADFVDRLPATRKDELTRDQLENPPYGSNLTFPLERYTRFHQTSGTTGAPMRWLDTPESWAWMLETWRKVFEVTGVTAADRVLVPFSFGPFLGFWTAFEAAAGLGCLTLPGGGLDSVGRLRLLFDNAATVLCCTPTYALRLAEVARQEGLSLEGSSLRRIYVAGEPGGGVPATRRLISERWGGAEVFDHHGMTEVGPVSFPNPRHPGVLHINEASYLAEVCDPEDGRPVVPGEIGELILTTLGRIGSPLLRYRTGDLVRASTRSPEELGFAELALEGGILARCDDMVVVRGVNLYPAAVEAVIRERPGVAEYRVELERREGRAELRVELEPEPSVADSGGLAAAVATDLRRAFSLRIPVRPVAVGTLPRFELKARRWRQRSG